MIPRVKGAFLPLLKKQSGNAITGRELAHIIANSQHLIYDESNGSLWFDVDDDGAGAAIKFAQLGTAASHPMNLTYADFIIV